ncbi:hypothetical protein WR25_05218 [Diploscapter pachys]|uniref:Uncharacterized protein n=1 Tax=Diploscapter pachys TaxID=2018661 RepID=A0A2A2K181_9BILA|nr:hypothetical protein WR25_05218 [Diploscapter pachys]
MQQQHGGGGEGDQLRQGLILPDHQDRKIGEKEVLVGQQRQAREQHTPRRQEHPDAERHAGHRQRPGQRQEERPADEAQAVDPEHRPQVGARQREHLPRKDQEGQRRAEDHREAAVDVADHVVRDQVAPDRQCDRDHRQRHRIAGDRRQDRHVFHRPERRRDQLRALAGPGVEIGLARIAHHDIVRDALLVERDEARRGNPPQPVEDPVIRKRRDEIQRQECEIEPRAVRRRPLETVQPRAQQLVRETAEHGERHQPADDRRPAAANRLQGLQPVDIGGGGRFGLVREPVCFMIDLHPVVRT